MKRINLLLPLLILLPFLSYTQTSYLIGTSKESIEPDQSLISVHLAGYGAPRDGRFSLQWINKGVAPAMTAMSGVSNKLFIVSNNDLLGMNPSENNSSWKKAGKAENIRSIAGLNDKLYAANNNGDLLESKVKGVKWKKIGSLDKSITSLAASGNKIYAANGNGEVWSADLSKKSIDWVKIESVDNIICLTANKGILYALTNDGVIYRYEQWNKYHKWLKIAYKNGQTIKEDIKFIAMDQSKLFLFLLN